MHTCTLSFTFFRIVSRGALYRNSNKIVIFLKSKFIFVAQTSVESHVWIQQENLQRSVQSSKWVCWAPAHKHNNTITWGGRRVIFTQQQDLYQPDRWRDLWASVYAHWCWNRLKYRGNDERLFMHEQLWGCGVFAPHNPSIHNTSIFNM